MTAEAGDSSCSMMRLPRPTRLVLLAFAALACTRASAHGPGGTLRPAAFNRTLALASFDTAWARINATYYDSTFRGHDWSAVRATFRPLAERATSMDQVRAAMDSLFAQLEDSHFALIPGEVVTAMKGDTSDSTASPGTAGLEFRLVDGQLLVSHVMAGSAAARAGIRAGWELLDIDGMDIARLVSASRALPKARERRRAELQVPLRAEARERGPVGSIVAATLRKGDQRMVRLELARTAWPGDIVKYGPLPQMYFAFEHERLPDAEGCVGVIRFSAWMPNLLPLLERAMEEVGNCRGIVLDLRGNVGGVAAMVMGASGFFVNREVALGTLSARVSTLRYMVNPRRANRRGEAVRPFAGSLAILVDGLSASTTELFAEGMRDIGRARVFGDTTAGQALPATMARLPDGDLLIHAIADFHSPAGRRLEAVGVIPDVVLPLTRRDLLAGRDVALATAVAWAGGRPAEVGSAATQRP